MSAIQVARHLRRLPAVMLLGSGLMVAGGVLDVVLHLAPIGHGDHAAIGSEHLAHLAGIAGMTLVLVGIVVHGARRHRRTTAARHGGLDTNAHR